MTLKHTSTRVALFTTALAGIVAACSADAPSGDTNTTGGSGGSGSGAVGGSAAGMAQAGASLAGSNAGSPATAGHGGSGGSPSALGGAGSGGVAAGNAGKGGTGGSPVQNGPVCDVTADSTGMGKISYERWLAVPGSSVSLIPVATAPSSTLELTQLKQGTTGIDGFGARIRGYLTAPLSGTYRFWINCDDNCELDLSTSESPANKVKLAWVEGPDAWTTDQEWSKSVTQKAAPVTLQKDQKYYLEVLHKEGEGGDHVDVGWQLPGESGFVPCEVVPGSVLSPFEQSGAGGEGGGAQ